MSRFEGGCYKKSTYLCLQALDDFSDGALKLLSKEAAGIRRLFLNCSLDYYPSLLTKRRASIPVRGCDDSIFDVVLSALAIAVFLPFFIPIALILKLSVRERGFFLQERVGKNKEIFKLIKFATMLKDEAEYGHWDRHYEKRSQNLADWKVFESRKLMNCRSCSMCSLVI